MFRSSNGIHRALSRTCLAKVVPTLHIVSDFYVRMKLRDDVANHRSTTKHVSETTRYSYLSKLRTSSYNNLEAAFRQLYLTRSTAKRTLSRRRPVRPHGVTPTPTTRLKAIDLSQPCYFSMAGLIMPRCGRVSRNVSLIPNFPSSYQICSAMMVPISRLIRPSTGGMQ
jgi:hypothetical protein